MNLWGRLGISVAFAALFSIVMTEALQTTAYYGSFKWHLCIGFFGSGVALYSIGYFVNNRWRARQLAKRNLEQQERQENEEAVENPFLLVNLAYWGVMLMVFAAITAFIIPKPRIVQAAATAAPVKTNSPAPPKTSVAVVPAAPNPRPFPKLNLQGVTFTKQNPSVLINGKTLRVGDHILDAIVTEISPDSATVEFDGQSKALLFGH
jgi:hypothetical protein